MDLAKYPLTELEQRLVNIAVEQGYEVTHLLVKVCEFSHPESGVTVYLVRKRDAPQVIEVMIHPQTLVAVLQEIEAIQGLSVKSGLLHHSNLRKFPKRLNRGVEEIAFGRSVECADITAFDRLLQTLAAS